MLTASTLPFYASSLDESIDADSVIGRALAMVESPMGANRTLAVKQYTEVVSVLGEQRTAWLAYMPIIRDQPVTVQVQYGGFRSFGRQIPLSEWHDLEPDDYRVDFDEGVIYLDRTNQFSQFRQSYYYQPNPASRVKVTYSSGFDFDAETPETKAMQYTLGQIIELQQSGAYQGQSGFELNRVYTVSYSNAQSISGRGGGAVGDVLNDLLRVFRQYRPRLFVGV